MIVIATLRELTNREIVYFNPLTDTIVFRHVEIGDYEAFNGVKDTLLNGDVFDTCYFKSDKAYMRQYQGYYIKLKPLGMYYSYNNADYVDHPNTKQRVFKNFGDTFYTKFETPIVNIKNDNKTNYYVHHVVYQIDGRYETLDDMKKSETTRLSGFNRVVDDNNYFSRIPEINEITHFDNGVVWDKTHNFKSKIISWDNFKITFEMEDTETEIVYWSGKGGHDDL